MRQFIKTIVPTDGYTEVKQVGSRYVVHLEGVQNLDDGTTTCYECMTENEPDLEQLNEDLIVWKNYIAEKELLFAKDTKCKELLKYDSSAAVNSFELRNNGNKIIDYWIDRDLRTSLEGDVIACSSVKDTYKFDIRELGITLELNCQKFLSALSILRQYAYTAYNITSLHMANIRALTSVQDVQDYDFTTDYPQKLVFNLEDLV